MNKTMMLGLLGLAILLGGCSAEPNEADISDAVKTWVSKRNEQEHLPKNMVVEFVYARKISCASAIWGYQHKCDVEIERIAPVNGRQKRILSVSLIHENDTWKVAE